jgi:choline dehydrogenase-like flavoprotein
LADDEETILVPYEVGNIPSKYLWDLQGIPIPTINNRTSPNPTGNVVGGSTAINDMYTPRGSPGDYDIWEELGNPGWGHEGLLPYFKKVNCLNLDFASQSYVLYFLERDLYSSYTRASGRVWDYLGYEISRDRWANSNELSYVAFPCSQSVKQKLLCSHYTNLHVEYFLNAIREIGSQVPKDHAVGIGAFWLPNPLDPVNRTRSFAATAHYEPFKTRPNLHLLPNNLVTKIIFNGTTATGVQVSVFCDCSWTELCLIPSLDSFLQREESQSTPF